MAFKTWAAQKNPIVGAKLYAETLPIQVLSLLTLKINSEMNVHGVPDEWLVARRVTSTILI